MKVKEAFKKIMAGDASREKFKNNPIGTLKEHGVDTDALPPEVLDKIAGAGTQNNPNNPSNKGGGGGKTAEGVATGVSIAVSIASI